MRGLGREGPRTATASRGWGLVAVLLNPTPCDDTLTLTGLRVFTDSCELKVTIERGDIDLCIDLREETKLMK